MEPNHPDHPLSDWAVRQMYFVLSHTRWASDALTVAWMSRLARHSATDGRCNRASTHGNQPDYSLRQNQQDEAARSASAIGCHAEAYPGHRAGSELRMSGQDRQGRRRPTLQQLAVTRTWSKPDSPRPVVAHQRSQLQPLRFQAGSRGQRHLLPVCACEAPAKGAKALSLTSCGRAPLPCWKIDGEGEAASWHRLLPPGGGLPLLVG